MQNIVLRRSLSILSLLAALAWFGAHAGSSRVSAMSSTPNATCSMGMTARDLGGGTWDNRNYVVEANRSRLPSSYTIYYQGLTGRYAMNLTFHGVFEGRLRWGVSTAWAYLNPLWKQSWRWTLSYNC